MELQALSFDLQKDETPGSISKFLSSTELKNSADYLSCVAPSPAKPILKRPSLEVVNRATLAKLHDMQTRGEPDFTIDLIDVFFQTAYERVTVISTALRGGMSDIAKNEASSLQTSADVLGAEFLSEICHRIQNHQSKPSDPKSLAKILMLEFEQLTNEFSLIREERLHGRSL